MKIVRINAKVLIVVLVILLGGNLALSIYNYKSNLRIRDNYNMMAYNAFEYDSSGLMGFLASAAIIVQEENSVEIFDINKGEVIKKVKANDFIQSEAKKYILGITNIYTKIKAFPDRGEIIKIPLNPAVNVSNQWLDRVVDKVFIILPENEDPYLLILDEKERPLFYTFEESTRELVESLNSL